MNKTNVVLVTFGLLTAASVFAKPMIPSPLVKNIPGFKAADDSVDFTKLNSVLQLISSQTLVNENQVTFAYPEFDLKLSSIARERVVYRMRSKVQKTQWNSDVEITASGDFSVTRNPSQSGISMKYTITAGTDILAMVRYGATNVLQKSGNFLRKDPRHAPLLVRAAQVNNMKDFYQILVDSNEQSVNEANEHLTKSKKNLDCIWAMQCGNMTVDAWGNRNMDNYGAMVEQLNIQEFARMRTSFESNSIAFNEETQEITILSAAPQGFLARGNSMNEVESKSSKVTLTASQLTTEGGGFGSVTLEKLDEMHHDLVRDANKIIENDSQQISYTQDSYREALVEFKKAINAENLR